MRNAVCVRSRSPSRINENRDGPRTCVDITSIGQAVKIPFSNPSTFRSARRALRSLLLCLPASLLAPNASAGLNLTPNAAATPTADQKAQLDARYGQLPLGFEANRGQFDTAVRYLAQGQGYTLFLTEDEAVLSLRRADVGDGRSSVIRASLIGAQRQPKLQAEEQQKSRSNYLRGRDPSRWVRDVEHYGRVRYQGVYPGVDLVYYGNQGELEYDFVVAPQAEAATIRMRYAGIDGAQLLPSGELQLQADGGVMLLRKPLIYQDIGGRRVPVQGGYVVQRRGKGVDVAFRLGDYDREHTLVIDPVLVYSTYLGGGLSEFATGIAVDTAGQAYVTGYTVSTDFPTQSPLQANLNGTSNDVFVSKYSADGQSLIYSTYLGGTLNDQARGIAVNAAGEAYVTGLTTSFDFPMKSALFAVHAGDPDPEVSTNNDVFVARLSADGQSLLYSTFLGGSAADAGNAIALDATGQIYIVGQTASVKVADPENPEDMTTLFPTQSALQPAPGSSGDTDAFVAKFAADGQSLAFCTFLGGSTGDIANSVSVDSAHRVFVAGSTGSSNFPLQSAAQTTAGGAGDAFVTAYAADGLSYLYSTYLGGSAADVGFGIAVGADGRTYVTGSTASSNFPTTSSAYDKALGGTTATDAFVTVFSPDGARTYSSYLGGTANVTDVGRAIAVDGSGRIYVSGYTSATDFPVEGPVQASLAGSSDAFVTELAADGGSIVFSSFLGGSGSDQGLALALDGAGAQIYFAGVTASTNFKTMSPLQAATGGGVDTFVARIGSVTVVAPGTLALSAASYSVAENAGTLSVAVSRTEGSSGAASVNYATSNGSATAGSDYLMQNGTLDWADGDSADKIITVTINDDSQLEPDETFTLSLSGAVGAAPGNPATATVTITNDDAAQPGSLQFEDASYFIAEDGVSMVVGVNRVGGSDGAASVRFATGAGTATAGTDYTAINGQIDWADGESGTKTFSVPITNDAAVEGNETFNLTLSGAAGAALGEPAVATVTIADDESVQPGVLRFDAASYSVDESAGSLTVTVVREIGSDGAVSVQYTTGDGSAAAGADYTATSGKLSWADGDAAAKSIMIPILPDTIFEADETLSLSLGAATGGAVLGTPNGVTATIVDDDVAANGSLQLDAASYQAREDGGSLNITVNRVGGSDGAVSVRYATSSGTATSGSDFTSASGTLSWASGDSAAKTVAIAILQDGMAEGRETFGFALSSPTGGAALGSPSAATATLIDDEVQRGTLTLSDSAYSVGEAGGSVTINVLRSGGSDGAISVDYSTADVTAASPADYTAVSGTLKWADGDAEPKLVVVPIVDDADYEPTPENFTVKLGNLSGGATLASPDTATVTIRDNEVRPGALQFEAAAYRVVENTGVVKVTVNRVDGTDNAVTVRYSTNQGTAISGSDYNAVSGTLSWAAGDATPRVLTIQILDDGSFESDETFSVALSQPTDGAVLGGPATTTVTIADDEVVFSGGIHLGASAYEVDEAAGSIVIAVVRGGSSEGTVSVAYSTVNGQAVSGSDYVATSGRLTWAAGDLEPKPIAVQILRDAGIEGVENFSVVLSNPTGGVALDLPSSASITITDASPGEGAGSDGNSGGGALDPRWLAVLLMAALMRSPTFRRRR